MAADTSEPLDSGALDQEFVFPEDYLTNRGSSGDVCINKKVTKKDNIHGGSSTRPVM